MALTDKLSAIGVAIREKTGGTELMTLDEMPSAIASITTGGSGSGAPSYFLNITGEINNAFRGPIWLQFFEDYGDQITTNKLTNALSAFDGNNAIVSIPFDFNFDSTNSSAITVGNMFNGCYYLEQIGDLNNVKPVACPYMFQSCARLRYLPKFNNWDFSYIHENTNGGFQYMFNGCKSLRSIDKSFLKEMYSKPSYYFSSSYYATFQNCFALDAIDGLAVEQVVYTTNVFNQTFDYCGRLNKLTFATQEDGTPYTAQWKNQVIDLSKCVGYVQNQTDLIGSTHCNGGFTKDTEILNGNKTEMINHPDSWSMNVMRSRYGHDAALETIKSLPDTSAYLTENGGTNTIKFKNQSGFVGGYTSSLTDEEIAIATAKGWTVTFMA